MANGADPRNGISYLDLEQKGAEVVELLHRFDAECHFIANDGPTFFFRTDHDAPRGRVVAVNRQ